MRRTVTAISFCAVLAATIVAFAAGLLAGHPFLAGCIVFVSLAALAWTSRGRWREGLVVACSLVFGLTLLGTAASMLADRNAARRLKGMAQNEGLVGPRDGLGWGATRPGRFHMRKVGPVGDLLYDVHATIDAQLNRRTMPSEGSRPIAFFGDSFIFGDGLDDRDALPQVFADLNEGKIPILNLGFSGWAPSQNLAALGMAEIRNQLGSPRHLILFTATFHIERVACKGDYARGSGPAYVLGPDGHVVSAGTCKDFRTRRLSPLGRIADRFGLRRAVGFDALTRHDVETYIEIIKSFVATARRDHQAETTVLFNPAPDAYLKATGYTEAAIIAALRAAKVDVLVETIPDGADYDLYAIKGDGHPTALANRGTARQVQEHLLHVDPRALEPSVSVADQP